MQQPDVDGLGGAMITVVSGLPRSGTSMMMQMLRAGGMAVLSDGRREADESNPRGYLEYEPVKRLRVDRAWVPEARGRAVKIIHLLLREVPVVEGLRYRVIFMRRPMEEVIASQSAMLRREGKSPVDGAMLRAAFGAQLRQVEEWAAGRTDVEMLGVDYHRVLREPAVVAGEVCGFLGVALDVSAMAGAVEPGLWRERLG